MMGNANSCSSILDNQKSMGLVADYNGMVVGLVMMNAEKDVNTNESITKKVKTTLVKEVEETTKKSELLGGF